ncbi:MAG: hypothetical protein CL471_13570 [Acidobacteria bacterium]|nr:hypothetical protein [Acidobacteriota bacterium]
MDGKLAAPRGQHVRQFAQRDSGLARSRGARHLAPAQPRRRDAARRERRHLPGRLGTQSEVCVGAGAARDLVRPGTAGLRPAGRRGARVSDVGRAARHGGVRVPHRAAAGARAWRHRRRHDAGAPGVLPHRHRLFRRERRRRSPARTALGQRPPPALRGARDAPAGLRGDDLRTARNQPAPRTARGELHEKVITDPLTTCYNRRFFDEVIGRELQRRQRYQTPLSLLFLDIDQFKAVNDTFGHETGDLVLQYVASFLKERVREADYLFRWGGDEFLVLMSCELDQAMQKGVDLKADFATAAETAKLPAGVGLSFGCTEVPHGTEDVMPLVKEADRLMYEHKTAKRARRKRRRT